MWCRCGRLLTCFARSGGKGSIPLLSAEKWKVSELAEEAVPKTAGRQHGLDRVRFPHLPLTVPVAERPRQLPSKQNRRVRLPPGTLETVPNRTSLQTSRL